MLKATGIIRKIDNLGRITLPIELRRNLDVDVGDPLEIYTESNAIVLKKYESSCVFCGSTRRLAQFKDKNICENCRRELEQGGED
jgi:transcriptional pleiotropic regulator of transition state genes